MKGLRGRVVAGVSTALIVGLVTAAAAVAAASSWTQASPSLSPPTRYSASMATDGNGNVLLFGGNGATFGLADTWLWNGADWRQPVLTTAPPGRAWAGAASAPNGDVVLFGGVKTTGGPSPPPLFYNDTWLWNGSSWTQASPSTSPPARYGAGMATDKNGNVVLFGGQDPSYNNLNDTWLWDGSTWTKASPATSPPARVNFAMATDKNGNVVLFGGVPSSGPGFQDTWLWNGSNWTQVFPAVSPSGRVGQAMASDPDENVILFGGMATGFVADTWIWDGSAWAQASPSTSPSARVNASAATDKNGNVALFGGVASTGPGNDTWLFGSPADKTPPEITVPADKSIPATSAAGAAVTYTVTATDNSGTNPTVTCTPPSGSVFAVGTTNVNCTATDLSGNTAAKSFTVHVKGAAEQLADLKQAVTGVGPGKSLAATVAVAEWLVAHHQNQAARMTLTAFNLEVRAQSGKKIPPAQATALIADANRIKNVLG